MHAHRFIPVCAMLLALGGAGHAQAQDRVHRFEDRTGTEVELHSGMATYPASGPAPAFAALDVNGDRSLSSEEARAYPLLATDFLHADSNRDGRLSEREYARWVAQR